MVISYEVNKIVLNNMKLMPELVEGRRQKLSNFEFYFLIFEIFLEKEERRNCFKDIKKEMESKFLFFNF